MSKRVNRAWDESKHPRHPAGTTQGGEFAEVRSELRAAMVRSMTPGQINKRLDALDKKSSKLVDALISAGRGHEKTSEALKKTDALSLKVRYVSSRTRELRSEIDRQMGPGGWNRFPATWGRGRKRG